MQYCKMFSVLVLGVFQINWTSEISTQSGKHWNLLLFHTYSRSIFQRHISWQVPKIAFQSLQIWIFSGGGYPQTPLQGYLLPSALAIMPPWYKNLATALIHNFSSCHQSISNCLSAAIDSFKRFVLQTKNNVQSRFIIKSFLGQLDSFGFTHCMLSEHCLVARLTSCQKNTGKAWH